jgi:hypothetical protein
MTPVEALLHSVRGDFGYAPVAHVFLNLGPVDPIRLHAGR